MGSGQGNCSPTDLLGTRSDVHPSTFHYEHDKAACRCGYWPHYSNPSFHQVCYHAKAFISFHIYHVKNQNTNFAPYVQIIFVHLWPFTNTAFPPASCILQCRNFDYIEFIETKTISASEWTFDRQHRDTSIALVSATFGSPIRLEAGRAEEEEALAAVHGMLEVEILELDVGETIAKRETKKAKRKRKEQRGSEGEKDGIVETGVPHKEKKRPREEDGLESIRFKQMKASAPRTALPIDNKAHEQPEPDIQLAAASNQ